MLPFIFREGILKTPSLILILTLLISVIPCRVQSASPAVRSRETTRTTAYSTKSVVISNSVKANSFVTSPLEGIYCSNSNCDESSRFTQSASDLKLSINHTTLDCAIGTIEASLHKVSAKLWKGTGQDDEQIEVNVDSSDAITVTVKGSCMVLHGGVQFFKKK